MKNERAIQLPSGETLHVEFKDEFLDVVRKAFDIEDVTDEDVKRYIYYSFKGALEGAMSSYD